MPRLLHHLSSPTSNLLEAVNTFCPLSHPFPALEILSLPSLEFIIKGTFSEELEDLGDYFYYITLMDTWRSPKILLSLQTSLCDGCFSPSTLIPPKLKVGVERMSVFLTSHYCLQTVLILFPIFETNVTSIVVGYWVYLMFSHFTWYYSCLLL